MTRARELSKLINASSFSVDSDFNVGVNSTSPDVKLDVGGAVLVTGISTFENTTQSTSSTTGALIVSGGVGIAKSLNVGGNLSVAGTITYDDVTNVDSVGIVTARTGVRVTEGGLVVTAGVSTFSGAVSVGDTISLGDHDRLRFGGGNDLQIYHDGSNSFIREAGTGELRLEASTLRVRNVTNGETIALFESDGAVKLRFDNSNKIETTNDGAIVTGILTATSFEGSGANLTNLPASGDSNDITACLFI